MALGVGWGMQLMLSTKKQIPGKSYQVPGGIGRGGTHCRWLARAGVALGFSLHSWGKLALPGSPLGA